MMLVLILGETIAVISGSVVCVLASIPLLIVIKIITKRQAGLFVMIFFTLAIGFLNCKYAIRESNTVYGFKEEKVEIWGKVSQIKESNNNVEVILSNVKINEYKLEKFLVCFRKEDVNLSIGINVFVEGKFKQLEKARNPGNYDEKYYYKSLGIYGKVEANSYKILSEKKDEIRNNLYYLKKSLEKQLDKICNQEHASIYKAMILGNKNDIDAQVKELYSLSGISHILAISGLHITFIGIFFYSILRRRFGFAVSASVSATFVIAFAILSGMGIATIRAVIMFCLKLFGEVLGRIYDYVTAISLSGIMLILGNPFVILNSGFQMSFAAIITITILWPQIEQLIFPKISEKKTKEIYKKRYKQFLVNTPKNICLGITITLCMNPIIAYSFYQLPTYSFLVNLLVVPLTSLVLGNLIIALVFSFINLGLGCLLIIPANFMLDFFSFICDISSNFPYASIIVGRPSIWVILIYYIIIFCCIWFLCFIKKKSDKAITEKENYIPKEGRLLTYKKYIDNEKQKNVRFNRLVFIILSILLCLLIYNPFRNAIPRQKMQLAFLDVGQGDGIYMRTPNNTVVLVDGGSTSEKNVGKYRLIPFLKSQGIQCIDYSFVTHTDVDHISGLIEILEMQSSEIKIKNIVLPKIVNDEITVDLIELAKSTGTEILYIESDDEIKLGQVYVRCLNPNTHEAMSDKNNMSTVLDVRYGKFSMILTGDISSEIEEKIVNIYELDNASEKSDDSRLVDNHKLSVDSRYSILKVAHHGSKNSSCREFLTEIKPMISVISVGEENSYGHPSHEVINRLYEINSCVFRTDEDGAVIFHVEKSGEITYIDNFIR